MERSRRYVLTLDGRAALRPYLVDDPRRQRFHIDGETHHLVFKRNGVVDLRIDGVAHPFNIDGSTSIYLQSQRRLHLLQLTPATTGSSSATVVPSSVNQSNYAQSQRRLRLVQSTPPMPPSGNQLNYVTNLITQLVQSGLLPTTPAPDAVEIDYFAISTFGLDVIPTLRSTNKVDDHVALLYGGEQCTSCGLRLRCRQELRTHVSGHLSDQRSALRQWYSSRRTWLRSRHQFR